MDFVHILKDKHTHPCVKATIIIRENVRLEDLIDYHDALVCNLCSKNTISFSDRYRFNRHVGSRKHYINYLKDLLQSCSNQDVFSMDNHFRNSNFSIYLKNVK